MAKGQASAPEYPKLYVHSNNPDEMGSQSWQGGIATIVKSVFAPGMWSKESGKHALFRHLTLREEDGTEHKVRYLRGYFGNTEKEGKKRIGLNIYPSKDSLTIASPPGKSYEDQLEEYAELAAGKGDDNMIPSIPDEEMHYYEGTYTVSTEPQTRVSNVDDKQLLACIREKTLSDPTDPNSSPFKPEDPSDTLCGHKFQWDRLSQEYAFKTKEGEEKKDFKILLPTHYFGLDEEWEAEAAPNGKTKEKPSSITATSQAEAEDSETEQDPFENEVEGKIIAFLVATGKPVTKRDISTHVGNLYTGEDRKKAIILCGNNTWITDSANRSWTFEGGKFSV